MEVQRIFLWEDVAEVGLRGDGEFSDGLNVSFDSSCMFTWGGCLEFDSK